jgi:CDP-paratose 2-epimerase
MASILITGICGFAGSRIAEALIESDPSRTIAGIDNLSRRGSEGNRARMEQLGIRVVHGDIRNPSDLEQLPRVQWIIDAAANASVLAGVDGHASSRQLIEHNLGGTINLLEAAKAWGAGLILLSTSRVYSIPALARLGVVEQGSRFALASNGPSVSPTGLIESFSTQAPVSLYGSAKLASEALALEYGSAFDFPVWINRCGNLAGAGQFGTPDQGVFAFWIHAHRARRALRFTGFGGTGFQVRDLLHPADLARLIEIQMRTDSPETRRLHASGGADRSISLAELNTWCDARFGAHEPARSTESRPFDVPWLVLDSGAASRTLGWQPSWTLEATLDEIARHAEADPHWLERSGAL